MMMTTIYTIQTYNSPCKQANSSMGLISTHRSSKLCHNGDSGGYDAVYQWLTEAKYHVVPTEVGGVSSVLHEDLHLVGRAQRS